MAADRRVGVSLDTTLLAGPALDTAPEVATPKDTGTRPPPDVVAQMGETGRDGDALVLGAVAPVGAFRLREGPAPRGEGPGDPSGRPAPARDVVGVETIGRTPEVRLLGRKPHLTTLIVGHNNIYCRYCSATSAASATT